jgi:hypothetical protein
MVPGMTERERLANDARRLEWLADAVLGPTLRVPSSSRARRSRLTAMCRHGLSAAVGLLHRARQVQLGVFRPRLKRTAHHVIA